MRPITASLQELVRECATPRMLESLLRSGAPIREEEVEIPRAPVFLACRFPPVEVILGQEIPLPARVRARSPRLSSRAGWTARLVPNRSADGGGISSARRTRE